MNLYFIINPMAGRGPTSALNSVSLIEEFCNKRNIQYKIVQTRYKGHATELARQAVNSDVKYDAVISVGGDGTLLEVANGLMGSDILLGILPAGTGNDFARAIGIPPTIKDALSHLIKKKSRLIDVGKLENVFFINVASVGFDAEIIKDIIKFRRFFPGRISYYIAALIKFFTFKFKDITIYIDGETIKTKILLVAIANGTHYGGGMMVNPNGDLEDGYLDVIVVNSLPRYKIPLLFHRFVKGTYQDLPYVKTYKCREISIDSKDSLVINADGDLYGSTPAKFTIKPLSLNVIGNFV